MVGDRFIIFSIMYIKNLTVCLKSLLILYKYSDNYCEAGKIAQEIYEINKYFDISLALYHVADAYNSYKIGSLKEDSLNIYKEGANLLFINCEPYYRFIFKRILENIKNLNDDINEFKKFC